MNRYEIGLPIMNWSGTPEALIELGTLAQQGASVEPHDRAERGVHHAADTTWLTLSLVAEDEPRAGYAAAKVVAVLEAVGVQVDHFARIYSETSLAQTPPALASAPHHLRPTG